MTESSATAVVKKRSSWKRWSRSPWFSYQLFFLLAFACVAWQAFNYWWGYCVDRALSKGIGSVGRQPVIPVAFREKSWAKHLARMEPITAVVLHGRSGEDGAGRPIVNAEELQAIKWLPFLKTLSIYGDLSPDAWDVLSEFQQIRRLQVITIPDDRFLSLAKLTRLEELTFTLDPSTSPSSIRYIASLPKLQRLRLGIPDLQLQKRINDMRAISADSTLQQLRQIAKSPSIKRLECRFRDNASLLALTEIQPDGEVPLVNLLELRIDESSITNAALANLHHIPNLIHLDLSHSRIDDDAMQVLKSLSMLRTLYLGGCSNITDESAATLASMHNLRSLSVADSSMTVRGMIQLASLPRLKRFRIGWMPDVPRELRERLPSGCELDVR